MNTFDKYPIDEIETKIMSILYSNIDQRFNQFVLFDKLIKDKYPELYETTINPVIKARFLLVIKNLVSRFDDIIVTKDNNVFSVVCLSNKDQIANIKNYDHSDNNIQNKTILQNTQNPKNNSNQPEYIDLLNYIINNEIEFLNYVDPFDGNTIYHDLVITSNLEKIKNLINTGKFNFFAINNKNETPIQLSKDPNITNLLITSTMNKYLDEIQFFNKKIEDYSNKLNYLELKISNYESKDFFDEIIYKTNIFKIIWTKFYYFIVRNKFEVISIFITIIAYFYCLSRN